MNDCTCDPEDVGPHGHVAGCPKAAVTFRPGVYRHYKGGSYRAISLVRHHDTGEPWVLYCCLKRGTMNIRPLEGEDGWNNWVEIDPVKFPGTARSEVRRFVFLTDDLDGRVDFDR